MTRTFITISLIYFTDGSCTTDLIKTIEEEVKKEEEEYLMVLSEDGCVQQPSLRYNINTKIKDILFTITTFGSVSIETSNTSTVFEFLESCFNSLSIF
jgi:hypothetical protein